MFDVLSASAVVPRPTPGRFLLAALLHGMILYAAARPATAPAKSPVAREILLEPIPSRVPETDAALTRRVSGEALIVPGPGESFPAPMPDVSLGLPPVSAGPAMDLSRFRFAATGTGLPGESRSGTEEAVLRAAEVDDPAAVIRQPSPRYPPVLQQAGIEGKVLLEFIIDSTGKIEPASVRVVERSRPGFDTAAMETIEQSSFRPARVRGRPVRQRTLQSIVFRIR